MSQPKNIRDFKIEGLCAPPCTPFKENGDINLDILPEYIQHMVDFGVPNAFVAGTNGEGNNMTVSERKQVMGAWVKASKGKLTANLIHIGAGNLRDSQELARHAQEIGADAIACVGPTYYKPQRLEDYVQYMQLVAAEAPNLPFYLYDIDFFTGIKFTADEFLTAAKDHIPTLRGVKHTSADFFSMSNILSKHPELNLLMGTDEMYLQGLALGINSTIMSSYMGNVLNRIREAFDKGDMAVARMETERAIKVKNIRIKHGLGVPDGSKAVLQTLGLALGQPRCPVTPVSQATIGAVKKDLTEIGFYDWATKK